MLSSSDSEIIELWLVRQASSHTRSWRPHTVRGLISPLGTKQGMKIESRRREDGTRVCEAVK